MTYKRTPRLNQEKFRGNKRSVTSRQSSPTKIINGNAAVSIPNSADTILQSALKNLGLDRDIARYQFVTHWKEIVGEEISKRTKPECIRNGALVVRVSDSSWAQELSFHKEVILKRLQRFIPDDEIVEDVHFYVTGENLGG